MTEKDRGGPMGNGGKASQIGIDIEQSEHEELLRHNEEFVRWERMSERERELEISAALRRS